MKDKDNIVYIGGFGKLAQYFRKNTDILVTNRNKDYQYYFDLNKPENIFFNKYIIFGACISEPRKCSKNFSECKKINLNKTVESIGLLLKHNKVFFLSSDLIFGGNQEGQFNDEFSKPKPIDLYGQLKLEVENYFLNHENFHSIRLSYLLFKDNSFTEYLNKCLNDNVEPEIIHPLVRCATEPSKLLHLIQYFISHDIYPKIYNLSGPPVSRVDLFNRWILSKDRSITYKTIHPSDSEHFHDYPSQILLSSTYNYV